MIISELEYLENVVEASEIIGGTGKDSKVEPKSSIASLVDDIFAKVEDILDDIEVKNLEVKKIKPVKVVFGSASVQIKFP